MIPTRSFGPIRQVAWVVTDLEATIGHWIERMGVGPWTVFRNTELGGTFGDLATTVKMDVGLSYQGDLQIELIRPTSASPSPYQAADGRLLEGLHHVAVHSAHLEQDLERTAARGLTVEFQAATPVVRVAYLNAPDAPGWRLEIIEAEQAMFDGFSAAARAAADWDGVTDPVTVYDVG